MSKKIHSMARGLAALGRGDDKMLVHMTPHEVAGLQKLAVATGGSLTINPKTGLPEAGYLSAILPMVVAGFATVASGGTLAPVAAAMYGAAAGAAGAKIEGEDPLMGAVGGAFGGMGGAGLAGGLINAGGTAVGQAAAGQATQALGQGATSAAMGNAASTLTPQALGTSAASGIPGSLSAFNAGIQNALPSTQALAGGVAPSMSAGQIAGEKAAEQAIAQLSNKGAFSAGVKALGDKGVAQGIWNNLSNAEKLGVTSTGLGALSASQSSSGGYGKGKKPMYYHSSSTIDPVTGRTTFGPGFWSKKYDYTNHGIYDLYNEIPDAPIYKNPENAYKAASGGYVTGRGDGVSDSIPTKIKSKNGDRDQPAALASGEFVIPARIVAEIGNGSSEAGARRLYDMMRRVEAKRRTVPMAEDSGAYGELPV